MSYLIQNFLYPSYSIKMSLRVRAAFLVRNIYTVYTLINYSTYINDLQSFNNTYQLKVRLNLAHFFNKILKILLPSTRFMRYVPIGVNFPVSAHYRSLSGLNSLLLNKPTLKILNEVPEQAFKYPYFTRHRVAITPIAKKPFSTTLYKFLRMTLTLWFYWPRSYQLCTNYTDITLNWSLLKFLSKYFFKVYSV